MWKQLEELRAKPEEQKKTLALFIALGITAVIAITWGTMLFASFTNTETDKEKSQTASPFDAIGSQFETVKKQIGEAKEGDSKNKDL